MRTVSSDTREFSAAKRGQVIQRVLVDRWSAAQAGAHFGIAEPQVARWVAAYQRHGMASLRGNAGGKRIRRRWFERLFASFGAAVRGCLGSAPARCIVLRRSGQPTQPISLRGPLWN
jgi:hypothetical protein